MRLLISTLPKSGTHLVREVVKRLGLKRGVASGASPDEILAMPDGAFALGHRTYSPELADAMAAGGVAMMGLVRDPRDFIVSLAHHRLRTEPGDLAAMLAGLIAPRGATPSVFDAHLAALHGWQTDPRVLIVRFEELVGARGGGSLESQLDAGRRMAAHLGLTLSDDQIFAAMDAAYRPQGGQFRRGQIGAWRDEMPAEIAAFINQQRADTLRAWGYDGRVTKQVICSPLGVADVVEPGAA